MQEKKERAKVLLPCLSHTWLSSLLFSMIVGVKDCVEELMVLCLTG
jgi:hypothetical protein